MAHLGVIQVRGLGDIINVIPIAQWYVRGGHQVSVAIDDRFVAMFQAAVPEVTFVPVPFSAFVPERGILNEYWYELPHQLLRERGCDPIMSFPQHECFILNKPNLHPVAKAQLEARLSGPYERTAWETQCYKHLKTDEFKYCVAKVPLRAKWELTLTRDREREAVLHDRLVSPFLKNLMVCHADGSNFGVPIDAIPYDSETTQRLEITPDKTDNIFDWLAILEKATSLVMVDSVFFNLVEQLNLPGKKYFIRRSPRESTPVIGNQWDFIKIDIPDEGHLY